MSFYKKFGSVFVGRKPKPNQINSFFFLVVQCILISMPLSFYFIFSIFSFASPPYSRASMLSSFIRWIAHEFIGSIDFVEHSRIVEHPDIHYMLSKQQTSKQAKGKVTRNNKAGLKRLLGGQKGPYNISFSDFFFF